MDAGFVKESYPIPIVRWYREGCVHRALVDVMLVRDSRLMDAGSIREAMRQAIRSFLTTSDGRALLADVGVDERSVTWGDVLGQLPNAIWRRYGLEHTGLVYQDGLLVPDEGPVFGSSSEWDGC